jgi:hypothetical protein
MKGGTTAGAPPIALATKRMSGHRAPTGLVGWVVVIAGREAAHAANVRTQRNVRPLCE